MVSADEEVLLINMADQYYNLQSRRGTTRVRRTWNTAHRLIDALSARHLGPKVRRAITLVRDLLANLEHHEPVLRAIQPDCSNGLVRVAA